MWKSAVVCSCEPVRETTRVKPGLPLVREKQPLLSLVGISVSCSLSCVVCAHLLALPPGQLTLYIRTCVAGCVKASGAATLVYR
uniref:Uncharacterized protein n=1 Tax=Anopheles quadriannulatus TaxID=34691 RepID=A0A182XKV1_ANOQN